MHPFTTFNAAAEPSRVREGRLARLRSAAAMTWFAMTPGFAFVRQRSNFIFGWEAAARAGAALAEGVSAGATGSADEPALGSWMMLPDLTTPATQTVLPMNDSLYGAAHLELDRMGPVLITVPADRDGRYYSVTVMDAHFTNVAHLGPRWTGRGLVEALVVPPGWSGSAPAGTTVIESPTVSVCLLSRVLVRDVPGDIDRAREWRKGFTLRQVDQAREVETSDLLCPEAQTLADPWRFLEIGFAHLQRNPLPAPARWAAELLPADELIAAREDDESRAAVEAGIADAQAIVDTVLTTWPRRDGWMLPMPGMGLPTDRVIETAALELFQVGYNDMAEAVYFFGDTDSDGARLDASDGATYELVFAADELPPAHRDGFWSLTMYGDDSLLVANDAHTYSIRPTSPGLRRGEDGSISITLAPAAPADDPNWLPAPDGPFRLGLRIYYPQDAVLDGSWTPPSPRRIA